MKQRFIAEAKKHQVFPMDASVAARIVAPRSNITAGRGEFVYTRPMVGLSQGEAVGVRSTGRIANSLANHFFKGRQAMKISIVRTLAGLALAMGVLAELVAAQGTAPQVKAEAPH